MQRRRLLLSLAACGLPASALASAADDALWRRLRGGHHVLLIRHAATDPGIGDPPGFILGQCATQRNLSAAGRRDAQALGAAMQARAVPIGTVWSSRWCRCLDTARLAFGRVEPAPMLDSMFQDEEANVRTKLSQLRASLGSPNGRGNAVLVTHDVNIRAIAHETVAPGEIVVARATYGALQVLGRLRVPA